MKYLSKLLHLIMFGLLIISAQFRVFANDSSFGDANGSILFLKQGQISMDKEYLTLSKEEVLVDYVFTNQSVKAIKLPMAFPMPAIYFGDQDHNEVENFKLWIDDKHIKTRRRLVVLLKQKTDVTPTVLKLGWNEEKLVAFLRSGVVPKKLNPLPKDWFDKEGAPRFALHEYFIWEQVFPAGQKVRIRHSYSPSIATGVPQLASDIIEWYENETCMDSNTKKSIRKLENVTWAYLQYILTTGNNWKGPIGSFTMRIRKSHPREIISLCFDGELKKVDPLTFEYSGKDFQPTKEIKILFTEEYR
jgi:hypothetical protein